MNANASDDDVELELEDLDGWEKAFDDDVDEGEFSEWAYDDEGLRDWNIDFDEGCEDSDAENEEERCAPSLQVGNGEVLLNKTHPPQIESSPPGKTQTSIDHIMENIELPSKYEGGVSILHSCQASSACHPNHPNQLLCPEVDIVKASLEMLLGYQSELFWIHRDQQLRSADVASLAVRFPTLRHLIKRNKNIMRYTLPSDTAVLTPLAKSLRTDSLSSQTVSNILSKLCLICNDLLLCRAFVSGFDDFKSSIEANLDANESESRSIVVSILEGQYSRILYALQVIDAEIAKMEANCIQLTRKNGIKMAMNWGDQHSFEIAQELSPFSIDLPVNTALNESISDTNSAIGTNAPAVSLFGLYAICSGWESMLSSLAAYATNLFGFQAIGTILTQLSVVKAKDSHQQLELVHISSQHAIPSVSSAMDDYAADLLYKLYQTRTLSTLLSTSLNPNSSTKTASTANRRTASLNTLQSTVRNRFANQSNESSQPKLEISFPREIDPTLSTCMFQLLLADYLSAYVTSLAQLCLSTNRINCNNIINTGDGKARSNAIAARYKPVIATLPLPIRLAASDIIDALLDMEIISRMKSYSSSSFSYSFSSSVAEKSISFWNLPLEVKNIVSKFGRHIISNKIDSISNDSGNGSSDTEADEPVLLVYGAVEETKRWLESAKTQSLSALDWADECNCEDSSDDAFPVNSNWRPHIAVPSKLNKSTKRCVQLSTNRFECLLKWRTESLGLPVQMSQLIHYNGTCDSSDADAQVAGEKQRLDVVLKPISDLLLHCGISGIVDSYEQDEGKHSHVGTASQLPFPTSACIDSWSDALLGSLSIADALAAISNSTDQPHSALSGSSSYPIANDLTYSNSKASAETCKEEADWERKVAQTSASPVALADMTLLRMPIARALTAMKRQASLLLVRGCGLAAHFHLLQDVYLLRQTHVFQYVKDLIVDERQEALVWGPDGVHQANASIAGQTKLQQQLRLQKRTRKSKYTSDSEAEDCSEGSDNDKDEVDFEDEIDGEEIELDSRSVSGSRHLRAARKQKTLRSHERWLLCQAVNSRIESCLPTINDASEGRGVTHHTVSIDVDADSVESCKSTSSGSVLPLLVAYADHIKVDLILGWPLRTVITVSQLASYNKCLQFLLPLSILKWCADSIWKSSLGTTLGSLSIRSKSRTHVAANKSLISPNDETTLEKTIILLRRHACIGLQSIIFVIDTLHSLYLTTLHEVICSADLLADESLLSELSSLQLIRLHEDIVERAVTLISVIKAPVREVVEKGFAAVAAIRVASTLRVAAELERQVTKDSELALYKAKLRNQSSHFRKAEAAIAVFKAAVQSLYRRVCEQQRLLLHQQSEGVQQQKYAHKQVISQHQLLSQFLAELQERLQSIV